MEYRIEIGPERKLIGIHLTMSFANNKTRLLWKEFMPRRNEIHNKNSNDLISMQIFPPTHFQNFQPTNEFEKWAAVEVKNFDNVPDGMETFVITKGLYAIFHYKGSSNDPSIFQYIYGAWIPNSPYKLDDRPHFEVLGEKYKNNDPASEEEIWIPIREKVSH